MFGSASAPPFGLRSSRTEHLHHQRPRGWAKTNRRSGPSQVAKLKEYRSYLGELFEQLNSGRKPRLKEEMERLRPLPERRLESAKRVRVRVNSGSLIVVERNSYSVNSRLIGEIVEARVYADHVEVWYGGQKMDRLERLRGRTHYRVDYRHIIDWLVRKPGAFASYRYREHLFPSSRFRMTYDLLQGTMPGRCDRRYLEILELAAKQGEARVEDALRLLLGSGSGRETILRKEVFEQFLCRCEQVPEIVDVPITAVSLLSFDQLLSQPGGVQ